MNWDPHWLRRHLPKPKPASATVESASSFCGETGVSAEAKVVAEQGPGQLESSGRADAGVLSNMQPAHARVHAAVAAAQAQREAALQHQCAVVERLVGIAACIGGEVLARCFQRLALDYGTWAAGWPDLLLWQLPEQPERQLGEISAPQASEQAQSIADGCMARDTAGTSASAASEPSAQQALPRAKFVEVKSQRDRASEKQHGWMRALCGFGAHAVFLRVQEAQTAEEKEFVHALDASCRR